MNFPDSKPAKTIRGYIVYTKTWKNGKKHTKKQSNIWTMIGYKAWHYKNRIVVEYKSALTQSRQ